ncbi:MAG: hypothetical protein KF901_12380 [Myxococcales bacterium]|nr:hypothetical protein [Myxococcales bacterium]
MRSLWLIVLLLAPTVAVAQEVEEPDPTRLDVERLPPEAIEITRDLYKHGWYVDAHLGARGFIGGVGRFSRPGPVLRLGVGYEIARWLYLGAAAEGSIHMTNAPSPPGPTAFEVLDFLLDLRIQANLSARAALWLGGEFGIGLATADVLRTYGFQDAARVGLVYGGQLGFDWHMRNRHHSWGLTAGARIHDGLKGIDGELAIAVHGTMYLRYVF